MFPPNFVQFGLSANSLTSQAAASGRSAVAQQPLFRIGSARAIALADRFGRIAWAVMRAVALL
jgi:hypothetical protein